MLDGTAAKNGIATRARKSGAACVSVMMRCAPLICTPLTEIALPLSTSFTPTMSVMKLWPGDCSFGFARRLISRAKLAAVTASPFENFVKPALTVKS